MLDGRTLGAVGAVASLSPESADTLERALVGAAVILIGLGVDYLRTYLRRRFGKRGK